MAENASFRNLVLSSLSRADFGLVEPFLEPVDLPVRKSLEKGGRVIKAVYFPENGFASVVSDGGRRPIEVGLIGREGMTGVAIVLGADRNDEDTFMQASGHGHCMRVGHLRGAMAKSNTLHAALLRYTHTFLKQTTGTAVANGRSKINERLARWLLMADDRIDGDDLALTHEFLAMMLCVRRPGVTVAIQELEHAGLIARKRGRIIIVDRNALERLSSGTYTRIN
jgi:CRP-like cAMP-binding protein